VDARGTIYTAPADQIPAEDTARLEGYLLAREDLARIRDDDALAEVCNVIPRQAGRQRMIAAERLRLEDAARRRYHRRNS
jgi:hypothetical protein